LGTLFFKPDGTKFYALDIAVDDIEEYTMSTAWDVSTASYTQLKAVDAQEATPQGFFIRADGLKLYVTGTTGDDVNEYTLSTAWSISTASFTRAKSYAAQTTLASKPWFKADGTKMYICTIGTIYEYALSTAWNVSTASYTDSFSFSTDLDTYVPGSANISFYFRSDGVYLYVLAARNSSTPPFASAILQYVLSTPWDVSTASLYDVRVMSTDTSFGGALAFDTVGSKMFIVLTSSTVAGSPYNANFVNLLVTFNTR
jgi:hypothetical protein